MTRKSQQGSASVEYALVTLVVMAALFAPVPGLDVSIVEFLLDALRGFQANTTYLMSMP